MTQTIEIVLLVAILGWLIKDGRGPKPKRRVPKVRTILDTCALIDGRILELTRDGFMPGELTLFLSLS